MNKNYAIKVSNLEKNFYLNNNRSVKSLFISREKRKIYKALDDINFEIKKGQFISIIGGNGSGKSTLLKIIAGIYHPNKGNVLVTGKVVSFIELGVGFNENLSAKDNVFLNGAILGIDKKQLLSEFDNIVDFAEVKPFINQKLKTFSTGMKVRLAFSIAIRASADIYLIDEVLSVGDESFGKKCLLEFEKLIKDNRTVVLVSHSMELVKKMSDMVIVMEKGKIINMGPAIDMVKEYQKRQNKVFTKNVVSKAKRNPLIKKATLIVSNGKKSKTSYDIGENIVITTNLNLKRSLNDTILIFSIFDEQGRVIFAKSYAKYDIAKNSKISLSINSVFGGGTYFINFGIFYNREIIFQMDNANYFYVENQEGIQGIMAGLNTNLSVEEL